MKILFYGSRRANKTVVLLSSSVQCDVLPTYGPIMARTSNAFKLAIRTLMPNKGNPEILLTDVGGFGLWLTLILGNLAKTPVYLRLRGDLLKENLINGNKVSFKLNHFALRRVDKIIPVCDYLRSRLQVAGIPKERTHVVHTPMMLDCKYLPVANRNGNHLLMVTNFHFFDKVKHIPDVVHAVLKKNLTIQLMIAGEGMYKETIISMLDEDVRSRVVFAGTVSKETMIELYQHSSLFLHVSTFDAFPSVIQEALSFGVPVIALATGGVSEMINQGKNGYVFKEIGDFCECVDNILCDDRKLQLMTAGAKKSAERWQVLTLMPIFKKVLMSRKSESQVR